MRQFKPERPNGVLFDAAGNVVYRFGTFDTDRYYEVPDYVDPFHGIEYADSPTPGRELGRPIEADPGREDLPNPIGPNDPGARPARDVDNPDAKAFKRGGR